MYVSLIKLNINLNLARSWLNYFHMIACIETNTGKTKKKKEKKLSKNKLS